MPTTYPTELKFKIIRRYVKGESIKALSQKLHVSQSTLYQWRKEYRSIEMPNRTCTPAEFDAMARRLKKLEHYMEIIHQSGYLSSVPLQKKLATLEELYNRPDNPYSVYELCDALGVARGTFYNHVFRGADRSKYEEEQAQLMLKVKQVFDDSEQRFGAEKIRIVLADSGIHVSKKRILAIMQEMGLSSVRVDVKKQFKRKQQYEQQNLLKREISAGHPNQIWVSDIAYFSTFKREEAYRKDYTSEQHFCRSVVEHIRFYNEVWPHQTLNDKTSQAFEDAHKPALSESTV